MMWTRFELKERGKAAFQRNYWRSVLVAFILMLFVSGGRKCCIQQLESDNFFRHFR